AVPPGGEYRLELGGLVYARWPASALSALSALSAVPPPGPPDAAPAPQPPAQDSGPPVPS
ncbi:MAG TPA: serine/threonine protein kinase, partial [Chloroflexota bacterium]|nr:serine/threonine protein kinase [Chloroflexota bacterium]